jgi:hypothetical protein
VTRGTVAACQIVFVPFAYDRVRSGQRGIAGDVAMTSSTQNHNTIDINQNVRAHILDFHAAAHVNSVDGVCQWYEYDVTFVSNHRRR